MFRRLSVIVLVGAFSASADVRAESPPADAGVEQARALFRKGSELAADARWNEALAEFERSALLRPHAATSYNIGICQRALGRYTRAQQLFARALGEGADGDLPPSILADIEGYLKETEAAVVRLNVRLQPADATISVDGAPLEVLSASPARLRAGTTQPGRGRRAPAERFALTLDPGTHVFVLSRRGFADVIVRHSFKSGEQRDLDLALEKLPSTLHVTSTEPRSAVSIDGVDVGLAPVALSRPAGSYRIAVRKQGFLPYEVSARARAGERVEVPARLQRDEPALTQRWWFWTAAGVVVAGVALGTYAATRPEPDRPAVDGGGLGWAIRAR
ncbi:MAG: PEGA domain-containing protein [Myxococcales bacterium]|nr:PEGA domain-containing protein [Myxococcales bacterium]